MPISNKLSDREKAKIIARYESGETMSEVARNHGVYPNTIRQVLTSAGIEIDPEKSKPKMPEISEYYLDILEEGIRPFAVSLHDKRVSDVAIHCLAYWNLLARTDLKFDGHWLYETTEPGLKYLRSRGRNV